MRYISNKCILTQQEQKLLLEKSVLIIGAGGLGGCVIEGLCRIGVGTLIIADGDVFTDSNLNRQLLATEENIGKNKAYEAKKRIKLINSNVKTIVIDKFLNEENFCALATEHKIDCVIDCTDNAESKILFEKLSQQNKIPFVFGAVGSQEGYVSAVLDLPIVAKLYTHIEKEAVTNSFIAPIIIGALQVNFAIQLMLNKPIKTDGIYLVDLQLLHISYLKI